MEQIDVKFLPESAKSDLILQSALTNNRYVKKSILLSNHFMVTVGIATYDKKTGSFKLEINDLI